MARESQLQYLVILQKAIDGGVHVFDSLICQGLGTLQVLDRRRPVITAIPELDDIHEDIVHGAIALDAWR